MANSKEKADFFKSNGDGSVTITLSRPIEIDGASVSALTMREPTVEDHLVAEKTKGSDLEREIALFGNLCGITPADVRRLFHRDYMRLTAAYTGNFFD
jgi:hypothetical protein